MSLRQQSTFARKLLGTSMALFVGMLALAPRTVWAPVIPIEYPQYPIPGALESHWNEFGDDGSMCPGACGSGCPDSCQVEPFKRCHAEDPSLVVAGDAYTCGIHSACSALEDCKSACNNPPLTANDFLGVVLGIRPAHAPVVPVRPGEEPDFEQGRCLLLCNRAAQAAGGGGFAGMQAAGGWASGKGPYDDAAVWEYTKEQPGGELFERCGQCEKCENGECVRDPDACPDGDPPPEPPPAVPPPLTTGDVHVTTLDGLRYDFQAVGEFVAFEDTARGIVLQLRTKAWGKWVSLTSAAAMRVNGDRVGFYVDPAFRLLVNGQPAELADRATFALDQGGEIRRFEDRYFVTWSDGTVVVVRNDVSNLAIFVEAAPQYAGQLRGIAGNRNDDPADDMATRQGDALSRNPSFEQLYGEFANSWRLEQAESLFDYAPGESTETFTVADFPTQRVRLADLDPAAIKKAEEACAVISHPRSYRDCVLDVAVTGDPAFVAAHLGNQPPKAELAASYLDGSAAADIQIEVPDTAPAGGDIAMQWSGTRAVGDFVAVAAEADVALDYRSYRVVTDADELRLAAPPEPGRYEVRYISGNTIAARSGIEITQAEAGLMAATEANSGSELSVEWTGPNGHRDYIAISQPDQPNDHYLAFTYTDKGTPLSVRVPDEPGAYELRYVQGQSRIVLARRELTVLPVEATLAAAAEAGSGAELSVEWSGPDNHRDYIAISQPDQPNAHYLAFTYTDKGTPLSVRVPDEPGAYELRYVQAQSRTVLARRELTVLPVEATLAAAAETGSGTELSVEWSGPDNHRDYIAISQPDQPNAHYLAFTYTDKGTPLSVRVPDEPGAYELRYVQAQSRTVLARRELTILPAEATLDAETDARAGGELTVEWRGPDNHRDYLAIARPDQPGNEQLTFTYTDKGSPLTIKLPEEPGAYELRYVQAQSRTILARQVVRVTED